MKILNRVTNRLDCFTPIVTDNLNFYSTERMKESVLVACRFIFDESKEDNEENRGFIEVKNKLLRLFRRLYDKTF
jgi:hypothetical protein